VETVPGRPTVSLKDRENTLYEYSALVCVDIKANANNHDKIGVLNL